MRLLLHAKGEMRDSNALALLGTPSAGASELLRQAYDRLFYEPNDVIPFYFEIKASDRSARRTAFRFLFEFLLQTVAFRRRDPRLIDASPELDEIAELADPSDGHWIDRLVEACNAEKNARDGGPFTRNCLSSPLRAAAYGARSVVFIDNLHDTVHLDGGDSFLDDLIDIFGRASIPFVFAGHRRFLFSRTPFETMHLEHFSFTEAGKFVESLAARTRVAINDQTRDLIAVQFGGNAAQITSLFSAADDIESGLGTFEQVEQVYTDAVFGGRIGKFYNNILDRILPDTNLQTQAVRLLAESLNARDSKVSLAHWNKQLKVESDDLNTVLTKLNHAEIVSLTSGTVEIDATNKVLCDYLRGRLRLEVMREPRAWVVGDTLSTSLKQAPELMARFYRRSAAIGLSDLLGTFDGRQVSAALIDYTAFNDQFKGADDEKIHTSIAKESSTFELPQIVYTAHTAAFYPKLNELCDPERSAVALGFSGKQETAWVAVEIDSKLEAKRDVAEFWCDRLEMVALNSDFPNYKLWLIAPEGFDPDAMEVLRERNAYGSSRKQLDLLAGTLNFRVKADAEVSKDDYEIVVPMGPDTEMIAAHTIEEIARRHNFPAKTINQIKTALVEACINATEHSLSPDRRIYQTFSVDPDKITITVANRGLRLADKSTAEAPADDERRGWGLKLMRGLMDDVKIERTDDGTRITMVKNYAKAAEAV